MAAGRPVDLEVDASAGRVTSIDFGPSEVLSRAELEQVASYSSNPAEGRTLRRRALTAVLVFLGLVGIGLVVARQARLREERLAHQDLPI